MKAEVLTLSDCDLAWLGSEWTSLEAQSCESFFGSWSWVGSWLDAVSDRSSLWLLRVTDAGQTLALAIFGKVPRSPVAVWLPRTLQLHETGRAVEDAVTVEHNGVLADPGIARPVWKAILTELNRHRRAWHRLRLSSVPEGAQAQALAASARAERLSVVERYSRPYYWVDLDAIRDAGEHYMDTLSRNTRYQIRRAYKAYGGVEALHVSQAQTLAEARHVFGELQRVHTQYWHGRGQPGAFGSEFATRFHDLVLQRAMQRGQLQLLTIASNEGNIGYLYNLVSAGRVMSYQSGFHYADDNKRKPGLVSHSLAIEHSLAQGHRLYDFLMGDSQYKRSLASHVGQMRWVEVRRPLLRFWIEDRLRAAKARLRWRWRWR
ncbi:GNAT family N-acetyltransferase [Thiohalocapsa sp.]|uniref:GNAT family N-acetyltransferase n=1 Tax=Thiohalocapsa sp. TaxID=2497641 RepID=UPI0025D98284|nr:GNAT family N-acetyltransferase [Thiohalocapsa sp.]